MSAIGVWWGSGLGRGVGFGDLDDQITVDLGHLPSGRTLEGGGGDAVDVTKPAVGSLVEHSQGVREKGRLRCAGQLHPILNILHRIRRDWHAEAEAAVERVAVALGVSRPYLISPAACRARKSHSNGEDEALSRRIRIIVDARRSDGYRRVPARLNPAARLAGEPPAPPSGHAASRLASPEVRQQANRNARRQGDHHGHRLTLVQLYVRAALRDVSVDWVRRGPWP